MAVYRSAGKGYSYVGGEWNNGKINFTTRELGDFTILTDSIAPEIRPLEVSSRRMRFKISDNLSGIETYEATVNGQWLLMHIDVKSRTIWSQPLEKNEPIQGVFELVVTDNAGNKQIYKQNIL